MPRLASRPCLLAALAGCLMTVCAAAGAPAVAAAAESWGELARFGQLGKSSGQFEPNENTNAFGVDQTDGSIYVGDEPTKSGEVNPGVFRLQKLTDKGEFLGEARFKSKCGKFGGGVQEGKKCGEESEDDLEGVVFDTVENEKHESERRAYVLGGFERSQTAKVDNFKIAAGALYAFSTTPETVGKEKLLPPAKGTEAEGVLAGLTTLKAAGENAGEALLEPTGIAVNPKTHEIVIAGVVDEGPGASPSEGVHLALQLVSDTGKLGARYVDPERERFPAAREYTSPVVTQTGQILMQSGEDQIVQIPFSTDGKPTVLFELNLNETIAFGEENPEHGGTLAIEPEGTGQGTLYTDAEVSLPGASEANPGVLALHYETGGEPLPGQEIEAKVKELGWTAGASQAAGQSCAIGFEGEFESELLAAAPNSEKKVFVFESGLAGDEPRIDEFGAGGSTKGCPKAQASEPQMIVENVHEKEVHIEREAELTSLLTGANALSVNWSFGDGTESTVSTFEEEELMTDHRFVKTGAALEVKATIHTDDLASPELSVATKVKVFATAPTAKWEANEVTTAESTSFNGKASTDPNGKAGEPLEYTWKFGDGAESGPSTSPTVEHKYATAGTYTATLTVKDKLGEKSSPVNHEVKVNSSGAPEKPHAKFTASEVVEGEVTHFNGESSTDPNGAAGQPLEYTWKFGDGTETGPSTNPTAEHKYAKAGPYNVTLIVEDKLGETGEITEPVAVKPPPPTAQFSATSELSEGETAQFNAEASKDPRGEALEYVWEFGDGQKETTTSDKISHKYASARVYTAVLTVKDKVASSAPVTKTITVKAVASSSPPPTSTSSSIAPPVEEIHVLPSVEASPVATIAGTALAVSKSGAVTIKIACPQKTSCAGTVTLKTLGAVATAKKGKKRVLTLASASVNVAGGQTKTVTLHLSGAAMALLKKSHNTLRAQAAVTVHNLSNTAHTTVSTVTLRAKR